MVFDLPTQTSTKPLLEMLNWMYVMNRFDYRQAIMVHKSINGRAPEYIRQMFKFVMDVRCVDTFKLYLPTVNHLKVLLMVFNMLLVQLEEAARAGREVNNAGILG